MSEYIENMRRTMTEAGVYSKEDIDEICSLESEYEKECSEIARQCEEEGYPSTGENYELRCASAREYYDDQIAIIDEKYDDDSEPETKVIKFEICMEVEPDFVDKAKVWEHHAERLLNFESYSEIHGVFACKVTEVEK